MSQACYAKHSPDNTQANGLRRNLVQGYSVCPRHRLASLDSPNRGAWLLLKRRTRMRVRQDRSPALCSIQYITCVFFLLRLRPADHAIAISESPFSTFYTSHLRAKTGLPTLPRACGYIRSIETGLTLRQHTSWHRYPILPSILGYHAAQHVHHITFLLHRLDGPRYAYSIQMRSRCYAIISHLSKSVLFRIEGRCAWDLNDMVLTIWQYQTRGLLQHHCALLAPFARAFRCFEDYCIIA